MGVLNFFLDIDTSSLISLSANANKLVRLSWVLSITAFSIVRHRFTAAPF